MQSIALLSLSCFFFCFVFISCSSFSNILFSVSFFFSLVHALCFSLFNIFILFNNFFTSLGIPFLFPSLFLLAYFLYILHIICLIGVLLFLLLCHFTHSSPWHFFYDFNYIFPIYFSFIMDPC